MQEEQAGQLQVSQDQLNNLQSEKALLEKQLKDSFEKALGWETSIKAWQLC